MSDDLVRQLRCYADIDDAVYHPWIYGEAASRIEKLESALREIAAHPEPYLYNDEMAIIARKALDAE